MQMTPLKSSNLHSVGYAAGTLRVQFHSGDIYDYLGVSPATYTGLLAAKSPGTFLHQRIKGKFKAHPVKKAKA